MSRDESRLADILAAARQVVRYTSGVSLASFLEDPLLQDAVQRQLQIVGEAAFQIGESFRAANPSVPWHEMIGMRHRLVHDYGRVDMKRVWQTTQRSIPALIAIVEPLVPEVDG